MNVSSLDSEQPASVVERQVSPTTPRPQLEHRCHVDRIHDGVIYPARAVCSCGWVGQWFASGARAVEEGTAHMSWMCRTGGRVPKGQVGAAAHAAICRSSRCVVPARVGPR